MPIQTVLDRFPMPPCATLLGFDILDADRASGTVTVEFFAKAEFCNASGNVQGGFLAAMLDDCMGPAILIATDAASFPSTIDLNVQFLTPARPGKFVGTGRVVKIGTTIGFVEAALHDAEGHPVARATASVRLTAMHKAVS